MAVTLRRVVVGLRADGRSAVTIDGPAPTVAWSNATTPADNADPADQGAGRMRLDLPAGAAQFVWNALPPGAEAPLHATDTLDYVVVLSGEAVIVTETGEARLGPGDLVVDRGVLHGWRNDGTEPCVMVSVMLAAHPVGRGADLSRLPRG